MTKNGWEPKTLPATSLQFDTNNPQLCAETISRAPREKALDVGHSVVARRFAMKASLASAVLLAALLAPSASAQYIYVANAGEDTVSKIDINTNQEVARIGTWFTSGTNHIAHLGNPWAGAAPSRIARGLAGDAFVLNRSYAHLPVLLKIAPTANGPVLPILDNNPTDNHINPLELTDVRIKWASEIGVAGDVGALGRSLCIDPSGFLWVGIHNTQRYYKVDSTTGLVVAPLTGIPTPNHRPYGCQVDTGGILWSVDQGGTLAEIDTVTNQVTMHNHATFGTNYSLSLFNGCGSASSKVYLSEVNSKTYIAYDPQTSSFGATPLPASAQFGSLAIGVDSNGDIISAERIGTGRVIKSHPNGVIVWDTKTVSVTNTVPAQDVRGVILDDRDDVWVVHLRENRVVKYSGLTGAWIATVAVGDSPYTYGNPPPPACPCAQIRENSIRCEGQNGGIATYSWSFLFTNNSPFSTPATAVDLSSSQVTNLTPAHFQFTNPVPVNGQATVSGTFTVANPVPGSQVCFDVQLKEGKEGGGWCCPTEHVCFVLPDCARCAKLQGQFICKHGRPVLQLSVTNLGPTAAQSVQIFSNTPGVTVIPQMTTQTFLPNTPVTIPLTVTGATSGQTISLTVTLEGPIDPKTGVNDWCCTTTVTVTYPRLACNWVLDGWVFNDLNRNGVRDSNEEGLSGRTVTLMPVSGGGNVLQGNINYGTVPRTTNSDATGTYRFNEIPPGTYRLLVQPAQGWRATGSEPGSYTVTIGGPPERKFDFGFVKAPQ